MFTSEEINDKVLKRSQLIGAIIIGRVQNEKMFGLNEIHGRWIIERAQFLIIREEELTNFRPLSGIKISIIASIGEYNE
jgi:hypothetical protein